MIIVPREEMDLEVLLDRQHTQGCCLVGWLGQAGFVIRDDHVTLVIDPYLSDCLAKKYARSEFPHTRLMPPPIKPEDLVPVDAVFCTHAHTDHMDPETLPVVAERNPNARFYVPRAASEIALARGVPQECLIGMNAGDCLHGAVDLEIHALASAHEELCTDEEGNHLFLGYILKLGNVTIYHSGDCVPYALLGDQLAAFGIDMAILPVNGRDTRRGAKGVPGNFHFSEAVALCLKSGIGSMIACHFGMFAFNTVSEAFLDRSIAQSPDELQCIQPRPGHVYALEGKPRPGHRVSQPIRGRVR